MTAEAWLRPTRSVTGAVTPATHVALSRWREVEVHHVDLGLEYTPADWSDAFALRLLREIVGAVSPDAPALVLRPFGLEHRLTIGTGENAPTVGGPTKSIAAWLAGRADGGDLTVSPDGELPIPPRWK
jgi:maleylpyruvate isomerase